MKLLLIFTSLAIGMLAVLTYVLTTSNMQHQQNTVSSFVNADTNIQAQSQTTGNNAALVTYTENGFSPQSIKITKGSTVKFINKSEMPLWVASDPHPEHSDYPEFDTPKANGGKMPGLKEDFSFTFEKAGTWKFHNHTASSDMGTEEVHPGVITVE